jgi:hypothetical protein
MKTNKAIKECARWLAYCIEIGWEKKDLDMLEKLWWKYHGDTPSKGTEVPQEIVIKMQREFEPHPDSTFKQGMYSGYAFGLQDGFKYAMEQYGVEGLRDILKRFSDDINVPLSYKFIDNYLSNKQKP